MSPEARRAYLGNTLKMPVSSYTPVFTRAGKNIRDNPCKAFLLQDGGTAYMATWGPSQPYM